MASPTLCRRENVPRGRDERQQKVDRSDAGRDVAAVGVARGVVLRQRGEIIANRLTANAHRGPDIGLDRDSLTRAELALGIFRQRANGVRLITNPVITGCSRVRQNPRRASG